jgi:predicted metal-dependent TIM-barrel fold hydrolase
MNSMDKEFVEELQAGVDFLGKDGFRPKPLKRRLNKNSCNEIKTPEAQIVMAADRDELLLIHTPHLEDKLKGTRIIMDLIRNESRIRPERVLIDHAEEHTIAEIKDRF